MIGAFEEVVVFGKKGKKRIEAKIDTGAFRTSIDRSIADELGLEETGSKKNFRSSLGAKERRLVFLEFLLGGRKIKTEASVADRSRMKRKMIVGRRDLKGFTIGFQE